jgi:hypothetical protein
MLQVLRWHRFCQQNRGACRLLCERNQYENVVFSKGEKWVKLDIRNKACFGVQSGVGDFICVSRAKLTVTRLANSVRRNPRIRR